MSESSLGTHQSWMHPYETNCEMDTLFTCESDNIIENRLKKTDHLEKTRKTFWTSVAGAALG